MRLYLTKVAGAGASQMFLSLLSPLARGSSVVVGRIELTNALARMLE